MMGHNARSEALFYHFSRWYAYRVHHGGQGMARLDIRP